MPATLTKDGDALELDLSTCRGSEFGDALDKIRVVPGRSFHDEGGRKVWRVPAEPRAADRILKTIRPICDPSLEQWIRESMVQAEESLTSPLPKDAKLLLPWANKRLPYQPETVNGEQFVGLLNFQRAAVSKMAMGRALLADDMGLGKTIESIAAVEEWRLRNGQADGPKLVICPSTLKGGWAREIKRWLGEEAVVIKGVYSGRKARADDAERLGVPLKTDLTPEQVRRSALIGAIQDDKWVIVNWEMLRVEKLKVKLRNGGHKFVTQMKEPLFEQTEWLAVIGDEAHRIKNPQAKQTKGAWRCRGKVMYALTGTPIMNSPDELWSLLRWLWPDEFHERGAAHAAGAVAYRAFYDDYVEYYEDFRHRKIITGVKNPDALRFVLKDKLIRRTAAILGLKGRKRIFFDVPLNPGQQKLYDEAEKAMWLAVQEDVAAGNQEAITFATEAALTGDVANLIRIPNGAARLVRLRQVIENAALLGGADDSALMDDAVERYEDSGGKQWVYFCAFKDSCDLLARRLEKRGARVGVFTGDVKPHHRTELEEEFQRGELDCLVGTIDAMYQGLNLQAAHLMYFLSRTFVPAIDDQAESRCDRKGQPNLVLVYVPQAVGTVATSKVAPIVSLKQTIERTILPKDTIREVRA